MAKGLSLVLDFVDAEGFDCEREVVLPSKFVVCHRCEGRGVHDAWEGGMTMDEMYEQGPEFVEDYFDGVYDVACSVCRGQRVLEVVDEYRVPADLKEIYGQHKQREYEYAEELAFEARMRRHGREW